MSNSDVTAAATPLTLGGVEYMMSPLDDRDISELDEWVQSRPLEIARRSMQNTPTIRTEERREMYEAALKVGSSLTWMSGEGAKLIGTVDGLARIVWHSVKKGHPKVTVEEIRHGLLDPSNRELVKAKFKKLNNVIEKKGPEEKEIETPPS